MKDFFFFLFLSVKLLHFQTEKWLSSATRFSYFNKIIQDYENKTEAAGYIQQQN